MALFCQMDLTGRTEPDPAAEIIAGNILSYVEGWKPSVNRQALYAGEKAGKEYMDKASMRCTIYEGRKLQPDQVLIAGPGSGQILADNNKYIKKWLKAGGQMFAVGLGQAEIAALFPGIKMKKAEHISACFGPFEATSPFAGIAPADVHNRAPREIPLVESGATLAGNGVLAKDENSGIIMCQVVPWHCDYSGEQHNIKQTFRRWAFLVNRLLGNMGVSSTSGFLSGFHRPVDKNKEEKRWLNGLYLDEPEEWDDPYRFFRW